MATPVIGPTPYRPVDGTVRRGRQPKSARALLSRTQAVWGLARRLTGVGEGRRKAGGSSRPDARLGLRQRTPKARITVWVTVFPAVSWAVARRETKRARFCGATGK